MVRMPNSLAWVEAPVRPYWTETEGTDFWMVIGGFFPWLRFSQSACPHSNQPVATAVRAPRISVGYRPDIDHFRLRNRLKWIKFNVFITQYQRGPKNLAEIGR